MNLRLWISAFIFVLFAGNCVAQSPIKDTLHLKQLLVFPVITRSIETNWSFGVATSATFHLYKSDTTTRTSNMQGIALYSLKKQFIAGINGTQYFKKEHYILNEQLSYSNYPDKFWGIGAGTPDSAQESYTFSQYYTYLHLMKHLANHCFIGLTYEMQKVFKVNYEPKGLFDQENVAGRTPYFVSGVGLSFSFDDRKEAFSPNKGTFAQLHYSYFGKTTGSDYNYSNLVLDYRKYFTIYKQQVLALQGYFTGNIGSDIPIRSLSGLGGSNSMRGYYSGRYRDKNLLVFQGEYRLPVYNRWGLAVFGSTGNVGNTFTDFSIDDLRYAYGAGLRFAISKSEKLNLRLDYGFGQGNNSGLYFILGEAF